MMAEIEGGEEQRHEHIKAFGEELGAVYHELYSEVVWLYAKWLEYRKLYAVSEEQIGLLNETAPFFFFILEAVLRRDILLHIARLTDPPKQGKNRNLTLLLLPELVKDKKLSDELKDLLAEADLKCKFARKWRDKEIAHSDFAFATDPNQKAKSLPGVSRQQIGDALASISQIMNRLYEAFFDSTVGFDHFITRTGADTLVSYLAEGVKSEKRRRERIRTGKPLPEDFE